PSGEETGGATGTVADPGGAPPDAVGEVRATQVGAEILWEWDVPRQAQFRADQLAFKYVLTRPGEAVVAETMRRNSLTTTAVSGENCLTVSVVVDASGRESAPVTTCVSVP
ncbi:MAG: serine/threonine protein kinase, partial [Pauljensenia sp.]